MGATESDQGAARRCLETARVGLRAFEAAAAGHATVPGALVHDAVTSAMNDLDAAASLLVPAGEVARVACRFCDKMIMPDATLCGFCWRAPAPKTPS